MNLIEHSPKPWSLYTSSYFTYPSEKIYTPAPSVYEHFSGTGKEENENAISSDEFRMFEFKIKKCTKPRSHAWTDCPYAHPGEKAKRRDPTIFPYFGISCPEFRKGKCERGVNCEFAHGIFEFWLHPARYRTRLCKDAGNCCRKVCFFAHSPEQLRLSPEKQECRRNRRSYGDMAPVDLYECLVSCLKQSQIGECGSRVPVGFGEGALFSKDDFEWVSELVK